MADQKDNVKNTGLQMELIDKKGKVAFQGNDGQTSVLMKGVSSIADDDYSVVFTDGYVTSPAANVPATSASSASGAGSATSASTSPASASSSANSSSSAKSAKSDAKSASSANK